LLADGKVYYLSRDGTVIVVAAKPQYELLATNSSVTGACCTRRRWLDGRLQIRLDLYLYCVGKK
jgi:outer membrane protein assembly factor BamB